MEHLYIRKGLITSWVWSVSIISALSVNREPDVSLRGERTLTIEPINTLKRRKNREREEVNKYVLLIYYIPDTVGGRKFPMNNVLIERSQ